MAITHRRWWLVRDTGRPASNTSARERAPLTPANTARLDDSAELYAALRLGLADYVNKNGFTSVLLGLSGGIDSAFVGALAVDALGADRVFGVAMPSRYSSTHSVQDAHDLAERTGLTLREVPIGPMFDAFQSSLHLTGLAEENLQASAAAWRIRRALPSKSPTVGFTWPRAMRRTFTRGGYLPPGVCYAAVTRQGTLWTRGKASRVRAAHDRRARHSICSTVVHRCSRNPQVGVDRTGGT